jgi:hypothetical protein
MLASWWKNLATMGHIYALTLACLTSYLSSPFDSLEPAAYSPYKDFKRGRESASRRNFLKGIILLDPNRKLVKAGLKSFESDRTKFHQPFAEDVFPESNGRWASEA